MFDYNGLPVIIPDWPAPAHIKAFSTTRLGGKSKPPFDALNLASHVGDNPLNAEENRNILINKLSLPSSPFWLDQTHGVSIVRIPGNLADNYSDASFCTEPNFVCAVLTADCVPVLFTDTQGTLVCAVHAGWKGLVAGILEATIHKLPAEHPLMAWIGPCIGPEAFEVGDEVREAFLAHDVNAAQAFVPTRSGHWLADLVMLAKFRMQAAGVRQIFGGHWCTHRDSKHFFSYRRAGRTGRQATLIWMAERP